MRKGQVRNAYFMYRFWHKLVIIFRASKPCRMTYGKCQISEKNDFMNAACSHLSFSFEYLMNIWKVNASKLFSNLSYFLPRGRYWNTGTNSRRFSSSWFPDWKNLHRLSERLASLSIMGVQLSASIKPLNTMVLWCSREPSIVSPWCREPLGQLHVRSL